MSASTANFSRTETRTAGKRIPTFALRQRAADHPVAMFSVLAAAAFAAMALTPAAGPAFASLNPPAPVIDGAQTTTKTARLPMPVIDYACKGQAWGAESVDCLRAIAQQSGTRKQIRMIASAEPLTTTPNVF